MDSFGGKEKELASGAPAKTDKLFLGLKKCVHCCVDTRRDPFFSLFNVIYCYLVLFITTKYLHAGTCSYLLLYMATYRLHDCLSLFTATCTCV